MPRADACIFVGYPFAQKGYKFLNFDTRGISVSRSVIFIGEKFPLHTIGDLNNNVSYFPVAFDDQYDSHNDHFPSSSNDSMPMPSVSPDHVISEAPQQNNDQGQLQRTSIVSIRPFHLNDYICNNVCSHSNSFDDCSHTIINCFIPDEVSCDHFIN